MAGGACGKVLPPVHWGVWTVHIHCTTSGDRKPPVGGCHSHTVVILLRGRCLPGALELDEILHAAHQIFVAQHFLQLSGVLCWLRTEFSCGFSHLWGFFVFSLDFSFRFLFRVACKKSQLLCTSFRFSLVLLYAFLKLLRPTNLVSSRFVFMFVASFLQAPASRNVPRKGFNRTPSRRKIRFTAGFFVNSPPCVHDVSRPCGGCIDNPGLPE